MAAVAPREFVQVHRLPDHPRHCRRCRNNVGSQSATGSWPDSTDFRATDFRVTVILDRPHALTGIESRKPRACRSTQRDAAPVCVLGIVHISEVPVRIPGAFHARSETWTPSHRRIPKAGMPIEAAPNTTACPRAIASRHSAEMQPSSRDRVFHPGGCLDRS